MMKIMKEKVVAENAQSAPGLLSQAIVVNGFIYTAGFIHVTPEGELVGDTTEERFHQVMKNLSNVLKAAGADFDDVVKVVIYVTDIVMLPEINEVYRTYFSEPMPAREAVCVAALPLGASIELSMVAIKS